MIKTAFFIGGAACGFALCSSMTEEQRRRVGRRAGAVTESAAVQRLGGSVHDAAEALVESAATKIDGVANAFTRPSPASAPSPVLPITDNA